MTVNYLKLISVVALIVTLSGCHPTYQSSYILDYQEAARVPSSETNSTLSQSQPDLQRFKSLYAGLKSSDLTSLVDEIYADDFYFNDTFHTFRNKENLANYLQRTSDNLEVSEVTFNEVAKSEKSYFLSWEMHIEFSAKGKDIKAGSIGITQIRFNKKGKVIFHQDFWDNTEGFFSHLPFLGYMLNKIRHQL